MISKNCNWLNKLILLQQILFSKNHRMFTSAFVSTFSVPFFEINSILNRKLPHNRTDSENVCKSSEWPTRTLIIKLIFLMFLPKFRLYLQQRVLYCRQLFLLQQLQMESYQLHEQQKALKITQDCYNRQNNTLNYDNESHRNISARVWRKIFQLIDCNKLRAISLWSIHIKRELVEILLDLQFSGLEKITLCGCTVAENEIKQLFARDWQALLYIDLDGCEIGDRGMQNILNLVPNRLEALNLKNNRITSTGLKCLLPQSTKLKNLKKLWLSFNNIGSRGVQYLVKGNLPQLVFLNLLHCSLDNVSFKHLTKGNWPKLERLWIQNNQGVSPQFLPSLQTVKWNLVQIGTSFKNLLSIFYFSAAVRFQTTNQIRIVCQQIDLKRVKKILESANVSIY